jgi:hypothetical protein
MGDADEIIWGAIRGVAVVVAGQLLSKFFIDPVHELKQIEGARLDQTL